MLYDPPPEFAAVLQEIEKADQTDQSHEKQRGESGEESSQILGKPRKHLLSNAFCNGCNLGRAEVREDGMQSGISGDGISISQRAVQSRCLAGDPDAEEDQRDKNDREHNKDHEQRGERFVPEHAEKNPIERPERKCQRAGENERAGIRLENKPGKDNGEREQREENPVLRTCRGHRLMISNGTVRAPGRETKRRPPGRRRFSRLLRVLLRIFVKRALAFRRIEVVYLSFIVCAV